MEPGKNSEKVVNCGDHLEGGDQDPNSSQGHHRSYAFVFYSLCIYTSGLQSVYTVTVHTNTNSNGAQLSPVLDTFSMVEYDF